MKYLKKDSSCLCLRAHPSLTVPTPLPWRLLPNYRKWLQSPSSPPCQSFLKGNNHFKEVHMPVKKKRNQMPPNTECSTLLRFPLTMFTSSTYPSRPCHTCETPSAVYPLQTDRSSCSLPRQTPVILTFKHVFHSGNNLIQQFILGKKCLSRFSAGISLSLHEFSFDSSNVKSKI